MILNATRLWILKLLMLLQKQRDLKASLSCFKQERFFHLSRWKQKNFDTLWMTFGPTCHPLLLPRNIALWLSCRCGLSACWATGTRGTWAGHKGCENGWLKWGCTVVATLCTKYLSKTFLGGKLQLFLQLLKGLLLTVGQLSVFLGFKSRMVLHLTTPPHPSVPSNFGKPPIWDRKKPRSHGSHGETGPIPAMLKKWCIWWD